MSRLGNETEQINLNKENDLQYLKYDRLDVDVDWPRLRVIGCFSNVDNIGKY